MTRGFDDVVSVLLEKGADIHAKSNDGYTAFCRAIHKGNLKIVSMLLEKGADVHDRTRVYIVCDHYNYVAVVTL